MCVYFVILLVVVGECVFQTELQANNPTMFICVIFFTWQFNVNGAQSSRVEHSVCPYQVDYNKNSNMRDTSFPREGAVHSLY